MNTNNTLLSQIHAVSTSHIQFYKFQKDLKDNIKYKQGRIDAAFWSSHMVDYFENKEKELLYEFIKQIENKKIKLSTMKNKDYKRGLIEELNKALYIAKDF